MQTERAFIPKRVFVEIDMRCAFNCSHCYQVFGGQKRNRHLTIAEAISRVRELKALGVKQIFPITGEVLSNPSYLTVFKEAGFTEYLLTTGAPVLKDESLAKEIRNHSFNGVRISTHYYSSGVYGDGMLGSVTEEQIPEIVKIMKSAGLYVDGFCILGTMNYKRIADICYRAMKDGIDRLFFINFYASKPELQQFCLDGAQIDAVFSQVLEAQKSPKLRVDIDSFGNFGPVPWKPSHLRMSKLGKYCPGGKTKAYIRIDGSVFPCNGMFFDRLQMGTFTDGEFRITHDPFVGFDRGQCVGLLLPEVGMRKSLQSVSG